jgi:transcriptional regulator GlxA family with amidase domain
MVHVYFVMTPGVLLLDYAGPAEALRVAQERLVSQGEPSSPMLTLHACGPKNNAQSSVGIALAGLEPLPTLLPEGSIVLVAGNRDTDVDSPNAETRTVIDWLKSLRSIPPADLRMGSICSGALLLARAGWLDGRHCTTHHSLIAAVRQIAPSATVHADRLFVDDGGVLTSAGVSTGIDLALYLIEQLAGAQIAAEVARELVVYQRRGTHDPQSSPWLAYRNHLHPAVHRAQDALAHTPEQSWTLAALARIAGVSPRHLSRLFAQHTGISIVAYQQQLRIARAKTLLTQQGISVDRVAKACGFGSARDLRRVWRRYENGSPGGARGMFQSHSPSRIRS